MVALKTLVSSALATLLASTSVVNGQVHWEAGTGEDNCQDLPGWTHVSGHGTVYEGYQFCASKFKEGLLITKLSFAADDKIVRGVEVSWDDGTREEFGNMDFEGKKEETIEYKPTEQYFSQVKLWNSGDNERDGYGVGRIEIEVKSLEDDSVTGGLTVSRDEPYQDDRSSEDLSIGKGLLLGIMGRAGEGLDRLDFIFANDKVDSIAVDAKKVVPSLEELNDRDGMIERGIKIKKMDEVHHINRLNESINDVWVYGEKTNTFSQTYTTSDATKWHASSNVEQSIEYGIAPLGVGTKGTTKFGATWGWENTKTTEESSTLSRGEMIGWRFVAKAQPNSAVRCIVWTYEAEEVEFKWEGNMVVTFTNGDTWEFPSSGDYTTTSVSQVFNMCENESIDDAMAFVGQTFDDPFDDDNEVKAFDGEDQISGNPPVVPGSDGEGEDGETPDFDEDLEGPQDHDGTIDDLEEEMGSSNTRRSIGSRSRAKRAQL